MTILILMNLGFAWNPVTFNVGWVQQSNQLVGPIAPQPVQK